VKLTEDTLLGGRVLLHQPEEGYRAAIDPVLLAASVPARSGETVLEPGIGAGAAALCLAARVPGCRIVGIEKDTAMARLARDNAALNEAGERVAVVQGDVVHGVPAGLAAGSFDHVMANPPYLVPGGTASPRALKAAANVEGEAGLADWVAFALKMVRPKGSLSFIHRADRLEGLLAALAGKAGAVVLFPLWPKPGVAAKRVLVHARKGLATPTRLLPGLVLHGADGRYTEAAEAVLRGGASLEI
jgi:tRNA1(Val) A37 N6-methylase TrmN6